MSGGPQVISQRCDSCGDGWCFGNTFGHSLCGLALFVEILVQRGGVSALCLWSLRAHSSIFWLLRELSTFFACTPGSFGGFRGWDTNIDVSRKPKITNELLLVPIFLSFVFGSFLLLLFCLFGSSLVPSTSGSRAKKLPVNMGSCWSSLCRS